MKHEQAKPNTEQKVQTTVPVKDLQAQMTASMFRDQCEARAQRETQEAVRATTPRPFPFSLLHRGDQSAERKTLLTRIEKNQRACIERADTLTEKKK